MWFWFGSHIHMAVVGVCVCEGGEPARKQLKKKTSEKSGNTSLLYTILFYFFFIFCQAL